MDPEHEVRRLLRREGAVIVKLEEARGVVVLLVGAALGLIAAIGSGPCSPWQCTLSTPNGTSRMNSCVDGWADGGRAPPHLHRRRGGADARCWYAMCHSSMRRGPSVLGTIA